MIATAPHAAGLWRAVSFRADVCHGGRRADGAILLAMLLHGLRLGSPGRAPLLTIAER